MSAHKIIEGLQQAVAGDLGRVTIEGQVWVRDQNSKLVKLRAALERIVRECGAMNKGPVAVKIARDALDANQ